ncbi:MAG: hypothetical protein LBQ14_07915 [Treponema sp.]|jgi:hypothetical protein|nr:hypothetical protein [Treponema sp.]
MGNVSYDASLDFGSAALASDAKLPNILDLGETSADRMTVDLFARDLAGGTALAVTVQGTDDTSGTPVWTDVGKNTFTTAALSAAGGRVAISPNPYRYLQVILTKSGTFTAGTVKGQLNTYVGK